MSQNVLESIDLFRDPRVVDAASADDGCVVSYNPATEEPLAAVRLQSRADYDSAVERAQIVQRQWRRLPAPKRGEIVRRIGLALREHETALGELVTLEMGKILPEGIGEVVECIDIADFSVGLSAASSTDSRCTASVGQHRMYEQWHPDRARSASSRRSTSPWRCGRGTRWSRPYAATP